MRLLQADPSRTSPLTPGRPKVALLSTIQGPFADESTVPTNPE